MKKILTITATLLAGLALAACSSNKSASSGKKTVEFYSTKQENVSTYKGLIKEFESKNKDIKVKLVSPADGGTVLKTRLTKNDIPDVLAMGGDYNFVDVTKADVLADLSDRPYAKRALPAYTKMLKQYYSGNKMLGMPLAANVSGVMYNKDLFKRAGINKTPETWDEFIQDMKQLQSKGIQPLAFPFKDSWTAMGIWNQIAGNELPASFIGKRKDNKTSFQKTHKESAEKFAQLLPFGQKDIVGLSYNDSNKLFAQGKVAMLINGNFVIPELVKDNKDINVSMFKLPVSSDAAKNKVTSGVDVLLAKSKQTKNNAACDKLISFLTDKENEKKYIDEQFALPTVKGVEQSNARLAGVVADAQAGNIVDYPDHLYPSGFDMAGLLQQFALNYKDGMKTSEIINTFLKNADNKFDSANVEE